MALLSTYGDTRRSRRRQAYFGVAKWLVVALVLIGGIGASYQVGLSQSRTEIARLEADIATMHELNRLMNERVAKAAQQAEAAITRHAKLQQVYRDEVPRGELRQLLDLVEAKLAAGVPMDRLAFVVREARVERQCEPAVETRRVLVHTPSNTALVNSVGFFDNRITVTSDGMAARTPEGLSENLFDPSKPVSLRFLRIDGDVTTIDGRLPLTHSLVLNNQEFLFTVMASDKQAGHIEITMQRCAFP